MIRRCGVRVRGHFGYTGGSTGAVENVRGEARRRNGANGDQGIPGDVPRRLRGEQGR